MKKIKFFRVILSNLKCAVCKEKNCKVRFFPERKKYTWVGGSRMVTHCKKDWEKRMNRTLP